MRVKFCHKISRMIAKATNNNLIAEEKKVESENVGIDLKGIGLKRTWWKKKEALERNSEVQTSDISSTSDIAFIESINVQDWMDLGKPCQPSYSTDINEMKDTLCSLLNFRLEKLVHSRNDSICTSDSDLNSSLTINSIARYIDRICELYIINDYHNFHHAYHVTISINKLVEMTIVNNSILHDDYLTHFALVFSALVHDVGHKGIPNFILIKLGDELAETYNKTSIAEKNSLKIAFDILNEECFSSLRDKIYGSNPADATKFENIAQDTILCTDIFNANRMAISKERWEIAFSKQNTDCEASYTHNPAIGNTNHDINELEIDKICIFPDDDEHACLQKTSALEHLIQVADVAHNFQSWEVFIKWNYRLVKELFVCHESGWMGDVTTTWNDGQQNFTDTYVLPLISRVHDMNIFSDADYNSMYEAVDNIRQKWKVDGKEICSAMQYGVKVGEKEEVVIGKILNNRTALTA